MNGFRNLFARRSRPSDSRKGLRTSIIEGMPAVLIANLLGGPLQTAFLLYLGFRSEQVGWVLAIPSLANMVQIVIAFGMQRWQNRRLLMALSGILHRTLWVSTGLIPVLLPHAAWTPVYVAVFLLCFLMASTSGVIWTSLMADIVPPAVRGRYFGLRNTIHWALACLTLLVGGQALEHIPEVRGFILFFSISACMVVWNGWMLFRYPNPPFQPSSNHSSLGMVATPLKDRGFRMSALFVACFLLLQNTTVPLFSYIMLEVLKLGVGTVTSVTIVQNLVMMASYLIWGNLNAKFATRRLLLWTFPIIACACAVWLGMAVLPHLAVLVVAHVLLGVGLGGFNLLNFNFLIGETPKADRPMYIGVYSALTGFAGAIGPVIGGWVFKLTADTPAWVQSFGIVSISGAGLMAMALLVGPVVFRIATRAQRPERKTRSEA